MIHTWVTTLLALSLSSTPPFVPKGSPGKPQSPPVEHPKPPPPPPEDNHHEHDRPDHDRPDHDPSHDWTNRGPYYPQPQDGSQYREDPAIGIIRRNSSQTDSCFARFHQQSPNVPAVVVVEWDINLDGRVERAQVMENSTGDTEVASCILRAVQSWEFRHRDATYPGHMRHSFQLQPS
jgi:hypothetical protein